MTLLCLLIISRWFLLQSPVHCFHDWMGIDSQATTNPPTHPHGLFKHSWNIPFTYVKHSQITTVSFLCHPPSTCFSYLTACFPHWWSFQYGCRCTFMLALQHCVFQTSWNYCSTFSTLSGCAGGSSNLMLSASCLDAWVAPPEWAIALGHMIDPSIAQTSNLQFQSYVSLCKLHYFAIEPTADTLSIYVIFMAHHILNQVQYEVVLKKCCLNEAKQALHKTHSPSLLPWPSSAPSPLHQWISNHGASS